MSNDTATKIFVGVAALAGFGITWATLAKRDPIPASNPRAKASPLVEELEPLRNQIAEVAATAYVGCKTGKGTGICPVLAESIRSFLEDHGYWAVLAREPGHVWTLVRKGSELAKVDIQPSLYERRVSHATAKRTGKFDVKAGVVLRPQDVEIHMLPPKPALARIKEYLGYHKGNTECYNRSEREPFTFPWRAVDGSHSPGYIAM